MDDKQKNSMYLKHYADKKVKISYKNDFGHERLATGNIIDDDGKSIVVKTVKDETLLIRHDLVGNILDMRLEDER